MVQGWEVPIKEKKNTNELKFIYILQHLHTVQILQGSATMDSALF